MAKKPDVAPVGTVGLPVDLSAAVTLADGGAGQWSDDALDAPGVDCAAMSPYWDQVGCIVTGAQAMRDAGSTYLPQFPNETKKNYEHRRQNAKFTNIYRDILEGLSAKPFEEPIKIDDGEEQAIKDFCDNVDGAGNNLTVFALGSFFNAINDAVTWIFVDYEKSTVEPGDRPRSQAEETALGLRPYWSRVRGKNMLDIKTSIIGGKKVLTYVRILEPGAPNQVRIIGRINNDVTWGLWEQRKNPAAGNKIQWLMIDSGIISVGVIPLTPVITGRQNGEDWQFFPPMRDAADLQIELYQSESGLKNVRNLSGFPMLSGNGVSPDVDAAKKPKELPTGPSTVLYGPPNPGGGAPGEWLYVQPDAAVLTFLQSDVQKTIDQLRELGRQPLTAQSGNLTTITAGVAAGKANSAVAMWALSLAKSLSNALEITGLFFGIKASDPPKVTVFTDFDIIGNLDDLQQLTAARTNGDLSQDTYWKALVRRDILPADFDPVAEKKLLLAEAPADDELDPLDLPPPVPGKPAPGKPPAPAPKPPAKAGKPPVAA